MANHRVVGMIIVTKTTILPREEDNQMSKMAERRKEDLFCVYIFHLFVY